MRWLSIAIYCITGIYTALCALYVLAGYASGLPVSRWSTALLITWFLASAALFLSGVLMLFGPKVANWLALPAASLLGVLFVVGLATVLGEVAESIRPGSHFNVQFVRVLWGLLVPIALIILSWLLALRRHLVQL